MNQKKLVMSLTIAGIAAICGCSPLLAATESIATFAADCSTPKTDFNLGDTVCAKVTGSPLGPPAQRQLNWINPAGVIAQSVAITADPQIQQFTLPATAISTTAGITVDNRRTWNITSADTSDASIRAGVSFPCHDPSQATVDLLIYKAFSLSESDFNAGSNVICRLFVRNFGPSAAQNVQVTDTVPTNASFVSVLQESGPAFTCSNSGSTTTCSAPSLANGAQAIFKIVYQLNSDTDDTLGASSVSTATFETDSSDNSSTAIGAGTAGGGGGGGCTITCPANITQNNDADQAGAIVNYPAPTTSGSCGAVTSDPPSGSFFPIGTTTVTGQDGAGISCTFTVTIADTRPLVITLNGSNPMTVECHTSFADPGATATKGNGDSVPVSASGSVDANTPGSYVITYTATDGTNSVTATRTVNVVDTTPPTITLNGTDPMAVECHTTFTDPGAIGMDSCAGTVPVTASGSVDANTPGSYLITYTAGDGETTVTATRTVIVVDTVPPSITCPSDMVVTLPPNSTATSMAVDYPAVTATDACSSATVSSTPVSGSVFSIGTNTVTGTATDAANNSSSCQFTVSVHYIFTGFFSPINNPPVLNTVNAGRSIPVKFSLSGNKGLNIFASGSTSSGVIACNSSDPAVDVTATETAGNSSLSYDPGSDKYSYVWKTDAGWAGTCRQLVIHLNDDTVYRANFKFK